MAVLYGDAEETEERPPAPYDRPDFDAVWEPDASDDPPCDPVTGLPLTPCPCCGAETVPEGGVPGTVCPVCGWAEDGLLADEWEPSAQNHGLSLYEARMNFRAFGVTAPWELWEKTEKMNGETEEDAEF